MERSKLLPDIRLKKITLKNFRNIVYSEIDIPGGKMSDYLNGESSVLGLYGQNGSGKTSLILAINALKTALSGAKFQFPVFSSCIRVGCNKARLDFEFSAVNEEGTEYELFYGFSLSVEDDIVNDDKENDDVDLALGDLFSEKYKSKIKTIFSPKDRRIVIYDETLQYSGRGNGKNVNKQVLIDTSEKASKASGHAFGNNVKYQQFTENADNEDIHKKLADWKIESKIESKSFIFNAKVLKSLRKCSSVDYYMLILWALYEYGNNYLFVIQTTDTAYNSMNVLPFSVWNYDEDGAIGFTFPISLLDHCQIPEEVFDELQNSIKSVSNVISQIVPGLSIDVKAFPTTIDEEGDTIRPFDLISVRNGKEMPLGYESDGIRRIISFLSLLVAVYNNPSVTVAIDEIDSGIFEYMLGELLKVIKESGKGQLIFTSHNLHPLEVLTIKDLLFTTINPEKRFAKLNGISGNNNLRDSYFRNIKLGTGKDAYYDATDTFNIERAMYEAGHPEE